MENESQSSLEERIARLEKSLFRIERVLLQRQRRRAQELAAEQEEVAGEAEDGALPERVSDVFSVGHSGAGEVESTERPIQTSFNPPFRTAPRRRGVVALMDSVLKTEDWFSKVGIALLLFGLVFLFKYAIDQGWLTPTIRILFGVALGGTLVGFGERLYESRRRFSLFLFGGGVVSLYATCFAAYQLFGLIPFPVAFGAMIAVTLLSFIVSVWRIEAIPALIAGIGGFATPFLLYAQSSSVPGLMVYLGILMTGCMAVYWFQGWRPLLAVSFIGAGIVLFATVVRLFVTNGHGPFADQITVQLGIAYGWFLFATAPLVREVIAARSPAPIPPSIPGLIRRPTSAREQKYMLQHINIYVPLLATLALLISVLIWDLEKQTWGLIVLSYAGVYAGMTSICSKNTTLRAYLATHGFAGILFFTISLFLLFENNALILALTFELMILHAAAGRWGLRDLSIIGHIIGVIVAWHLLGRFAEPASDASYITGIDSLTELGVLLCGYLVCRLLATSPHVRVYQIVVHVGVLGWFLHGLAPGANGQAMVSIAWGVYATILLVIGLRRNASFLRRLAIGTLGLIVAKLFVVDLARLEMIWRVIVFLGFGAGFLLLSYFFRSLWRQNEPTEQNK